MFWLIRELYNSFEFLIQGKDKIRTSIVVEQSIDKKYCFISHCTSACYSINQRADQITSVVQFIWPSLAASLCSTSDGFNSIAAWMGSVDADSTDQHTQRI